MTPSHHALWDQLRPFLVAFRQHPRLWGIPAVTLSVVGILYAAVLPTKWKASQSMLVRDEAIGNQNGQAQFGSIDWMKVYQEKILEVARSRQVVEAALIRLGTSADGTPPAKPSDSAIADLQGEIHVSAPQGAEFGRTSFFHLSVTGKTPAEALRRTRVVCEELERNLGTLRNANAQSVIHELERAQELVQADLEAATKRLEALEREVGPDLGELRLLTETGSGDSNLRGTLNQVNQELRQLELSQESLRQLHGLLRNATQNPTNLLVTPSRLLESQPGLKSLKDGLNAAQIESSRLRGTLSENHPKVQAALQTEERLRKTLGQEVQVALRGVEADLAANQAQIERARGQYADAQKRLDRLASLRARYGNLVADTRQRTQTLDGIRQKLADARSAETAANSSSQLIRYGEPVVGERPVGPSKKMVVAGGMVSGLLLGSGLVFLFMPLGATGGEQRWSNYLNMGRRATDQLLGRRATDRSRAAPGTPVPVTAGTSPAAATTPAPSEDRRADRQGDRRGYQRGRRATD